jgi:hypothetical protein
VRPHLSQPTRPRPSQASQRGKDGGDGGGGAGATPGSAKPSLPRPRHAAHVTVVDPRHVEHLRGRSHAFASGTAITGSRKLTASAAVAVDASTPPSLAATRMAGLRAAAGRRRRRRCSASGAGLVVADAAAGIDARMIDRLDASARLRLRLRLGGA